MAGEAGEAGGAGRVVVGGAVSAAEQVPPPLECCPPLAAGTCLLKLGQVAEVLLGQEGGVDAVPAAQAGQVTQAGRAEGARK